MLNLLGPSEAPIPHSQHHIPLPHILSRSSSGSGKVLQSSQSSPTISKDVKLSPHATSSRRNSWMSSLSSKFSSTPSSPPPSHLPATTSVAKTATGPVEQPNPFGAAFTPGAKDARKQETAAVQNSQHNKSSHPSFLQSALRRLSSSGVGSLGKVAGGGGVVERKTMNIDPYRPRCSIPDLEPAKLRRVAFCVDVEIAGPVKYIEEEEEETRFPGGQPCRAQQEQAHTKKMTDEKLGRAEGEDFQITATTAKEAAKGGVMTVSSEGLEREKGPIPAGSEIKEPIRKREKKKRSEEERKARKERKRNEALANGEVIAELWREGSSGSGRESPAGVGAPPKSQDRPTTDPLRIYRRCCQLRETSILKRITEQIALPSACPVATPGVLSLLDLSNYWMQLVDLVTLSDYLAVVPVKRLILENCGLGDEAVRVILAGLLAVKTPEQAKHNKKLSKKCIGPTREMAERLGVIEKISLKNNPNIGHEGWRYIAYFINMSRSLKAIDLSLIPFPQLPAPAGNINSSAKSPKEFNSSAEIASLLQKAMSEKLGGSNLEELVMAECNLGTDSIEKIVAGVIHCGITRLGLASNNLTSDGLAHVLRYLQTGKCQGLDLGGNDLRDITQMLADSLDKNNALYALSLADCKLSPKSVETLLPALVRLPNFRFIDLSHNHHLFDSKVNALGLLRKYIPQFPILKRIHLLDVAMSSEQAIALAEVLPESPSLAHLNILENQPLSEVASANDEASQEEACALYASLMAAVRVSSTIICIDIDVPGKDSSEVVKALAKQVVAYSLRNLERITLVENSETGVATTVDSLASEKEVHVPDILMHLVGHEDGVAENHDNDEPAPDDDYIVGGTGVVKALGVCLNRAADHRKPRSIGDSGAVTPIQHLQEIEGNEESKGKAKEMSKNLLASARKIRARLVPALIKEAKSGDMMSYSKWPAKVKISLSLKFSIRTSRIFRLDT